MLKSHKNILLKNRADLVRDLEPNDLVNFLYQEVILSENDVELLKAEKTRKKRAEMFLDLIPRKGPKAFDALIESLRQENGTKHLAEALLADSGARGGDAVDAASHTTKSKHMENYATKDIDVYPMNHGLCLIINNTNFQSLTTRHGSVVDAENLRRIFSSLNFTVRMIHDATVEVMSQGIQKASEENSFDCFVVCLLSHGVTGKIYDINDELVSVSQLMQPLILCENNPSLAGKPKLFFIQACRNTQDPSEINNKPEARSSDAKSYEVVFHQDTEPFQPDAERNLTSELFVQEATTNLPADVLLSFSTIPGEASWRNSATGSWFIDALVEVFKVHAAKEDVLTMLTKVNHAVSSRVSSKVVQLPSLTNTLRKKLYFNTK